MAILIGIDEAGYGPNLGPLTVAASAWSVPVDLLHLSLYEQLADIFVQQPKQAAANQVCITDSKVLYSSGGSLARLEQAVLPLAAIAHRLDQLPASWSALLALLAGRKNSQQAAVPWYQGSDLALPHDADAAQLEDLWQQFSKATAAHGVELVGLQASLLEPAEFNQGVERWDNKAELLSRTTLELASSIMDRFPEQEVVVHCDKHGGRNRYAGLLQDVFPEYLVEVHSEGQESSWYRWGPAERRVEFHFTRGGESCLATALASMLAKYLRELCMKLFNQFWCSRLPELKPTAGYPQDAIRFRDQIQSLMEELSIDPACIWRSR